MKKRRFTEEQIVGILKQAEAGMKVVEVCRQNGLSDATFDKWREKSGGMTVSEARRLPQLAFVHGVPKYFYRTLNRTES